MPVQGEPRSAAAPTGAAAARRARWRRRAGGGAARGRPPRRRRGGLRARGDRARALPARAPRAAGARPRRGRAGHPAVGAVLAAPLADRRARGRAGRAARARGVRARARAGARRRRAAARRPRPDRALPDARPAGAAARRRSRWSALLDGDGPERAERLAGMLDADGLVVDLDVVGAATRPGRGPAGAARRGGRRGGRRAARPAAGDRARDGVGHGRRGRPRAAGAGVAAVDVGGAGAAARRGAVRGLGRAVADAVAEAVLLAPGLPVVAGGPLARRRGGRRLPGARGDRGLPARPFADRAPEAVGATRPRSSTSSASRSGRRARPSAAALGPGHLRVASPRRSTPLRSACAPFRQTAPDRDWTAPSGGGHYGPSMAIADDPTSTVTTSFWHPFADMGAVSNAELVIERGEGATCSTADGKRYLDGTASLWYANLGHGRADITRAVAAQMDRLAAYSDVRRLLQPARQRARARGSPRSRRWTTRRSSSPPAAATRSTPPRRSPGATGSSRASPSGCT